MTPQTNIHMTDAEIEAAWGRGNDAGEGYAVGFGAISSPQEAAEFEGLEDIRTFDTSTSTAYCVIARDGSRWVAICDANGPWAVDIITAEAERERDGATCEGKRYIIESRINGAWTDDAIGENEPRSYEECEADIASFRAGDCGPDFVDGEYRIVELR